ncbi:MAG: DUF4160 domain-containing protein [Acidobacteria bacterium]|nr:DUF4160 domain-containing protein [Acidobacteriota bacterium]
MLYRDHAAPHFHAFYGEEEWRVGIQPIRVLTGGGSGRVRSLLLEWAALHQDELLADWVRAQNREPLLPIDPLD